MMATTQSQLTQTETDDLQRRYSYELCQKLAPMNAAYDGRTGRPLKERLYQPKRNILFKSYIIWDGSDLVIDKPTGKRLSGHAAGKRLLRYYDGCTSIFADEQPQDKETIDNMMMSTRDRHFIDGFFSCYAYETMLKKYIDICSYNSESPYRVRNTEAIFKPVDAEAQMRLDSELMDWTEEAMKKAKETSEKHMLIHARFLELPTKDMPGNPLSTAAIRQLYRKEAAKDPVRFLKSFNDKTIEVKYWIEQALQTGAVSTTLIPGKAVWAKQGIVIADISGITTHEGILNKLIEHSQLPDGDEFSQMLKGAFK